MCLMPTSLDDMLREFLEREKQSPIDEIRDRLVHAADWQAEHEAKDESRHRELMEFKISQERRTTRLEADVEHLTKDVDTGQHNLAEIQRKANRLGSDPPRNGLSKFLGSEVAKGVAKGLALVLVALLGWCAHHVQLTIVPQPAAANGGTK